MKSLTDVRYRNVKANLAHFTMALALFLSFGIGANLMGIKWM